MAKEPENDLAQLFAAALDEETKQARPGTKAKPGSGSKGAPPVRGGVPKVGADDTVETIGAEDFPPRPAARPAPAAPSRSMPPPDSTQPRAPVAAPSTRPAARPGAGSSNSGSSASQSKRVESMPALGNLPARAQTAPSPPKTGSVSIPPANTGSGAQRPSAPTALAAPAIGIKPGGTAPSMSAQPSSRPIPVSVKPGLSPSKNSVASSAALMAIAGPPKPSSPPSRTSDIDGLNVLPKSEAQTIDKVPAFKRGPLSLAPPTPLPASLENRPSLGVGGSDRPSQSPNSKSMASGIRGRPAAELSVETAAEQLDHKGRSKPIFQPRSPRPTHKRLHPVVDLVAGLIPGARAMAREKVTSGLAYAIVGILTLLPAITVWAGWTSREMQIDRLAISRAWIVAHAGVSIVSVFLFELIRSGASLDPQRRHLRGARWLAAVTVPALVAAIWGPSLVKDLPAIVEPLWFLAIPLACVGLVATVDVLARGVEPTNGHKAAAVTASTLAAGLVAAALVLVISLDLRMSLERKASDAGFVHLPSLIRALRLPS